MQERGRKFPSMIINLEKRCIRKELRKGKGDMEKDGRGQGFKCNIKGFDENFRGGTLVLHLGC
jgi:hypothetical protein